jgi:hypothetical protein
VNNYSPNNANIADIKPQKKMKKTLTLILLASAISAAASEPFLLRKERNPEFLKSTPASFVRGGANAEGNSNIVVKMNLTQLTFRNFSFQGEFAFHPKMSFALGFSYLMQRPIPSFWYDDDPYFSRPTYGGFAITPEFRFYPSGDEDQGAPHGFYLAPYLRYAKYNLKQTVSYTDDDNKTYSAEAKQTYGGVNGGLMIGYQWIIGDHFSIDLWIFGLGYGKAKYTYGWEVPGLNMSASEQAEVKELAESYFSTFSLFGFNSSVETTPNSATMSVRGIPMYSMRLLGLNFGYAF